MAMKKIKVKVKPHPKCYRYFVDEYEGIKIPCCYDVDRHGNIQKPSLKFAFVECGGDANNCPIIKNILSKEEEMLIMLEIIENKVDVPLEGIRDGFHISNSTQHISKSGVFIQTDILFRTSKCFTTVLGHCSAVI